MEKEKNSGHDSGEKSKNPCEQTTGAWTWFRKHEEKFGIRYFGVLTVTTSAARMRNLIAAAEKEDDVRKIARMFLFTEEEKLSLECAESIFEHVWTVPMTGEPVSILGEAPSKNPNHRRTTHERELQSHNGSQPWRLVRPRSPQQGGRATDS